MNDLNYGFCLEDASLDMLLRLLFDQMEAEEIDAYLSASAPGLTDEEAASLRRAYDRAVRQHAREKKREKFARLRRAGRRLLDRVALVILILSLTVTAALAVIPLAVIMLVFHFLFYRCPHCGAYLGRNLPDGFCPRCGKKLGDSR